MYENFMKNENVLSKGTFFKSTCNYRMVLLKWDETNGITMHMSLLLLGIAYEQF